MDKFYTLRLKDFRLVRRRQPHVITALKAASPLNGIGTSTPHGELLWDLQCKHKSLRRAAGRQLLRRNRATGTEIWSRATEQMAEPVESWEEIKGVWTVVIGRGREGKMTAAPCRECDFFQSLSPSKQNARACYRFRSKLSKIQDALKGDGT